MTLEHAGGGTTLLPPRLQVDDHDGNGKVSEGDLLTLSGLIAEEAEGTVVLSVEGKAIGTVRL
ncbi:MAG: hypothetical protein GWN18_14295 [Thermoplasmata archaeon]|nr:hypothetical protein [Thermoplasmata archaeon]NIS13226.1 hypothetical protein [Thermoplasmata archaeon]NIS21118.1 hypothetical protein [Thermoplasmata archaeon]NIT78601.1 hypothetical protein [Thermoplasmata archaeon]NIU50174.1 hypothetical protein [Thermoplasmata archaeon]